MKKVFKYPLCDMAEVSDTIVIPMPRDAEILCAQLQGERILCVWALVDPNAPPLWRTEFRIAGTGHPIEGDWIYIDTFQMFDGGFVGHVFYRG